MADERSMLESWLEYHRATLEVKCDGVPPERLAERTVPPSDLSLLGLVRHMADVERNWCRDVWLGEDAPGIYYTDDDPDGDFLNAQGSDVDEAFATWHRECDNARATIAGAALDDLSKRSHPTKGPVSLRWILIHLIEEYARHNGHADLLRQALDGAVGE